MEKKDENFRIKFDKTICELLKADFVKLKENINTKLSLEDNIEIEDFDKTEFTIMFIRSLRFIPKSIFEIEVKFKLTCIFDKESQKYYEKKELEKIEEFIEKNKEKFIQDFAVVNKASLLISQITSFNGLNPLITPPILIPKR